ncbi:MAG: 30S ribosomal protein S17 [Nitriliruptoraceae bacterium]
MADTVDTTTRNRRKQRVGVVVSAAHDKTIVVRVDRRTTHPLYGKTLTASKKYHVHDEANEAGIGDLVRIAETRPISKLKRWRLASIVERAK